MVITVEGEISGLIKMKRTDPTELHPVCNLFVFLVSALTGPLIVIVSDSLLVAQNFHGLHVGRLSGKLFV